MAKSKGSANRELMLLRVKLEQRTWFLRASLAFNVSLIAGIIARLLIK